MKKKHRKLQTKENLIVFPGMIENLIADGLAFAENNNYVKAAECFDIVKQYTELDDMIISVYVLTLLETRRYLEAKEICEELMEKKSPIAEQIVEIYLTILLDLKEYKEVDNLLNLLLADDNISDERKMNFEQLKDLSSRLALEQTTFTEEAEIEIVHLEKEKFALDVFTKLSFMEQELLLQRAFVQNISEVTIEISEIVECEKVSSSIRTIALLVLGEAGVTKEVTVSKFGIKEKVNPADLPSPKAVDRMDSIDLLVEEILEQDPSKLALTSGLVRRHAYALFPFDWLGYDDKEIAQAYVNFVEVLFGEENKQQDDLYELIKLVEDSVEIGEDE
ncbi:hypothetical protein [Psychrobacillus sp.]|uniref:hypothetical protein n=1 Tax=Psychrobacillus sp. TaxID=1871623 RepID=UPI0028BF1E62|nr:hypothetical protein [Psychrobacillus sp.]